MLPYLDLSEKFLENISQNILQIENIFLNLHPYSIKCPCKDTDKNLIAYQLNR